MFEQSGLRLGMLSFSDYKPLPLRDRLYDIVAQCYGQETAAQNGDVVLLVGKRVDC